MIRTRRRDMVIGRLRGAVELLPFGRDLMLLPEGRRTKISYRGVYRTAAEARAAIPASTGVDYDEINEARRRSDDIEAIAAGERIFDTDYPLLFWAGAACRPDRRILELGGNVGQLFYALRARTGVPDSMRWTIAELPHAVALGSEIAAEQSESRLAFVDSTDIAAMPDCDVFITSGTIQYIERDLTEILADLPSLPAEVIVHNTPMHPRREWWTRQNLGMVEVPYRVYSRVNLADGMARLGYRVADEWKHQRPLEIPFNLGLRVRNYRGVRFVLER